MKRHDVADDDRDGCSCYFDVISIDFLVASTLIDPEANAEKTKKVHFS
jgi:hypothetical protein